MQSLTTWQCQTSLEDMCSPLWEIKIELPLSYEALVHEDMLYIIRRWQILVAAKTIFSTESCVSLDFLDWCSFIGNIFTYVPLVKISTKRLWSTPNFLTCRSWDFLLPPFKAGGSLSDLFSNPTCVSLVCSWFVASFFSINASNAAPAES